MIIILVLALLIILGVLFYYRYQIRQLSQQLQEMSQVTTNQLLTQELYSPEISNLVARINQTIEQERLLRKQIQAKERQMDELMTNLSHDVRTPLTSLVGYIQLLEESENPDDRDRYFTIIYQRLNKLNQLLDRLFLLMRLEDQSALIDLKPMNLQESLVQRIFIYYDQLEKVGFKTEAEFSLSNEVCLANDFLLDAIVDNLMKNVLDHGQEHSTLTLSLSKANKQAVFRISNPLKQDFNADLQRLTERFYQANASRTSGNSGLGLSIVHSALQRLGGSMELQLEEAKLVISLYFPLLVRRDSDESEI
ncbi:HAMP domain-containing sensor histidine kinase [Ignavigranum ruoffiae]|uniref:sensor histidine kinase n=1 Tax=Ignavigranum ruoffiae TaxID=89093 RepID=UPI00235496CC|nr:HAMP domain-containing sensor histidine kinase [Ignavigranum ruoffiae]